MNAKFASILRNCFYDLLHHFCMSVANKNHVTQVITTKINKYEAKHWTNITFLLSSSDNIEQRD